MKKKFHIGDLLSISTGVLLSHRGMSGVYGILDFIAQKSHLTTELPSASDRYKPFLNTPLYISAMAPMKYSKIFK